MKLTIHTDGGARGNPGPAAVGIVIEEIDATNSKIVAQWGKAIGNATNNVAEYTAVIEALRFIKERISDKGKIEEIHFYLDSTLVVNQVKGLFKVKESHLRALLLEVHVLEQELPVVPTYTSVPRAQNARADFFVNQALDALN